MLKDLIGKASIKVKNTVERGAVKKFAEAIGDMHPIYIDEETGKRSRYQVNIAPPTYPRVFDYGHIDGLKLPNKGLIHGEEAYHYERPLLVGEDVYCYTKITQYYEKNGAHGEMGFLVLENNGEDRNGRTIFTSKSVVIITEAVRRLLKL
ncbi:MaoC family dehydratase N-terminal domain-containing protein [Mesobacillus foraminis]|uniref:MaoC family dehydratase N-terminal domain-containing protein n=1 Tax=Mesobacillus foraminis TaxID=279826 RepID=UPI000EF52C56|nr:MaoC family dehydratase N-terminal domain-containing protein [Mesobacillus foraminis]